MPRGRKKKTNRPMRYPNGYGSVSLLSHPEQRRNPYVVLVPDGAELVITASGKPKKKYKYIHYAYAETREDGDRLLKEYHLRKNQGLDLKNGITFIEIYKKAIEKLILINKPSEDTISSYEFGCRHCSSLHDLDINDIKTMHMQNIINNMIEESYKTPSLRNVRKVMNLVFKFAMENDLVEKNYAEFLDLGRSTRSKERRVIPMETINMLFEHDNMPNVDLILIYIYTGLRLNELLLLETRNIHLDERYLRTGSKTEAGRDRIVPINRKIEKYIKNRFNPDQKYFLETQRSTKFEKNNFRRSIFTPAMEALNLDYVPHECRHTLATMLDDVHANKRAMQLILGHAGRDTTEEVYIHKNLSALLEAIDLL